MITVRVDVTPSYPVLIGPGILAAAPDWTAGRRVALISDERVAPLHAPLLSQRLRDAGHDPHLLTVPAGEGSKSVAVWGELLRSMARAGFGRDDVVLSLGGGVVTDLAGFVAASYARGLPVIHAPTTLLAMADAAIGGKTGIDLPEGKNLVGAFWQPKAVLMDVTTLRTLPQRVFLAGAVEVFKHGLIADPTLVEAVVTGAMSLTSSDDALTRWVGASARVKAEIVARDERETGTVRATLNLGHTVAHAFEAVSGHAIDHGSAVAWGLLYASHLSREYATRNRRPFQPWTDRCLALLRRVHPPTPPNVDWSDLMPYLARDKKNRAGARRWVLADAPGSVRLAHDVTGHDEQAAWEAFTADVAKIVASGDVRASLTTEGGTA